MARAVFLQQSLISVVLALCPATAIAQTAFSNVSPTGARLGTQEEYEEDKIHVGFRIDGGYSSASMPVRTTANSTTMQSETRRTAVMAGSVSLQKLELFLSSIAWDSQVGSLSAAGANPSNGTTIRQGRIYKQWGDVALGVRRNDIGLGKSQNLRFAVEAGAQFYGKNASDQKKDTCCPGISGDATSLFTRGHMKWRGGKKLSAAGSAGLLYDRTSYIWEELENDLATGRLEKDPYPEERRAFGIYGNKGMLRLLGGAGVDYEISNVVGVFGETTVELNASELALRLTPGVRVNPLRGANAAFLAYLDVNPVGANQKLSPAEPPLRVNVGMAYAFGERPPRTKKPKNVKTGGPVERGTITFRDEKNRPLANIEVQIGDAPKKRTDAAGRATFERSQIGKAEKTLVRVTTGGLKIGYLEPLTTAESFVYGFSPDFHAQLAYTFTDQAGGRLRPGTRVHVTVASQREGVRYLNEIPDYEVGIEPPKPLLILVSSSESWNITAQVMDRPEPPIKLPEENPQTLQRRVSNPRTFPLNVPPAAISTVIDPPRFIPQRIAGVFETDLAQVRPSEVKKVAEALRGGGRKMTVVMKGGGDPVFMQVMLKARCEQLVAALKTEAASVPVSIPECGTSSQGTVDEVVVE